MSESKNLDVLQTIVIRSIYLIMNYLITEDQFSKLIQASRERHKNAPTPYIRGSIFDFNGEPVTYGITIRKDHSVYANYQYKNERHIVYIMNDYDFVQLDKKGQRGVVEPKIKKDIERKNIV
jgi:cell division protein FtsI/penicillin-binding protein 2